MMRETVKNVAKFLEENKPEFGNQDHIDYKKLLKFYNYACYLYNILNENCGFGKVLKYRHMKCYDCDGSGLYDYDDRWSRDDFDGEYGHQDCDVCDGTGVIYFSSFHQPSVYDNLYELESYVENLFYVFKKYAIEYLTYYEWELAE